MKTIAPFKRGDTFSLACTWKVDNTPTDITGLTITSQIRASSGALIVELRVVAENQTTNPGKYALVPVNPDTHLWPIGDAYCDIQVDDQGVDRSSETFLIPIIEDITK